MSHSDFLPWLLQPFIWQVVLTSSSSFCGAGVVLVLPLRGFLVFPKAALPVSPTGALIVVTTGAYSAILGGAHHCWTIFVALASGLSFWTIFVALASGLSFAGGAQLCWTISKALANGLYSSGGAHIAGLFRGFGSGLYFFIGAHYCWTILHALAVVCLLCWIMFCALTMVFSLAFWWCPRAAYHDHAKEVLDSWCCRAYYPCA